MQTVVIKLNPEKLENPDADLRYDVPTRIEDVSNGLLKDNGFDYLEDGSMGLWLQAASAMDAVSVVVQLLREERFAGNDLSASAEIYVSRNDADDIENCTLVYPKV